MSPRNLMIFWSEEGKPPAAEPMPEPFAIHAASHLLGRVVEIAEVGASYLRSDEARGKASEQGFTCKETELLAARHDRACRHLQEVRASLAEISAESIRLFGLAGESDPCARPLADDPAKR